MARDLKDNLRMFMTHDQIARAQELSATISTASTTSQLPPLIRHRICDPTESDPNTTAGEPSALIAEMSVGLVLHFNPPSEFSSE